MGGLNIRLRIWLSIAIFALGYSLSTTADYVGRLKSERDLDAVSNVLIPAAQNGHSARNAYTRLIQGYADSFLMRDSSGLERAAVEGRRVMECLNAVAHSKDIVPERSAAALDLEADMRTFVDEADATYPRVPSGSDVIAPELEAKLMRLGRQANRLEASLTGLDHALAADLDTRTHHLRMQSAQLRWLSLGLLAATLAVAGILVNLTVERSILRPLARVQSELAEERDLLRILLEHIPDHIYFKDAYGKFIRINHALAATFGVKRPEEAIGHSDADYFDAETAALIQADDARIRASGKLVVSKIEQLSRSGTSRWVATTKVPVIAGMPPVQMIVGISRDVTEWKQMMEELEQREASIRLLFSAIPQPVFVCDVETLEFLEVNDAACRTYGYSGEEFLCLKLTAIYAADDHAQLRQTMRELGPEKPWRGFRKHVTKDGRILDVEIADHFLEFQGHPAILVTAQDVTEQKRLELELRHAQRLEAVGQLAAGIAHEINTPIQYVGDNLRFLRDAFLERQSVMTQYERLLEAAQAGTITPEILGAICLVRDSADLKYLEREIPKALQQSMDGAEHVATIVRAMKSFAHPGADEKRPADLNKALSDALIVARNELKYVADVVTDFGDLPLVLCHLGDLNQVFLNLLVNAAHAIGDVVRSSGARGEICVRTRLNGADAVVSISDTGCGIPAEIVPRVFDPFFTTKDVGRGTGQGLAIARNIVVEKHGGRITFEPNVPQGTTFVVVLPVDPSKNGAASTAMFEGALS